MGAQYMSAQEIINNIFDNCASITDLNNVCHIMMI